MKAHRTKTRDRHEDRGQVQEKLSQPADTMPAKTLADREKANQPKVRNTPGTNSPSLIPGTAGAESGGMREVLFRLKVPEARSVLLAGTFNDWNPGQAPLFSRPDGEWNLQIRLHPGRYEYRFVVDGKWMEDPASHEYATNPFGERNSVITLK